MNDDWNILTVEPCGLCLGWVARYGRVELEDDCPLVAAWRVLVAQRGAA